MAPLNPTVNPTNDPNFRGYSQPISVPDTIKPQGVQQNQILPKGQEVGDRSAEYEGKGIAYGMQAEGSQMEVYGDLFKNIAQMGEFIGKGGVAVTKKAIEDKVYEVADRERQAYTATLEQIKQNGGVNNILNPSADDSTNTPQDVAGLADTLSTLKSAKDGGKISSSYYEGRLLAEAKKLRAQYPGFREEIDAEFAKVTGSNPANAYVRALATDINRQAAAGGSELKKAESFILQRNGYPGARGMMDAVHAGRASLSDAMTWAAPYEQEDFELTRRSKVFNDQKTTKEAKVMKVGELFDFATGVAVNRHVDAISIEMGLRTAEDASKLDTAAKAGIVPQQQWVQWGQNIAQRKTELAVTMQRDALKSGAVQILGQTEVNKRIEAALKPMDALTERIYQKDTGGYFRLSQDLKAINEESQKRLLEHPKLGPYLQVSQAMKEIGGESNMQKLTGEIIKGDFNSDLKTYFTKWQQNFATQYNMRNSGVPTTFNDVIDDIKAKGIKDKKFNVAILSEVNKITDGSLPEAMRMNYAQAAFSPGNRGMISKLSADGVDAQGRPVTGQSAIFQKFTSAEMTKAMFALGRKDPQVWKNYVDWAQETLGNELINKDINTLAEVRNPTIKVGWDSDNKRLKVNPDVSEAMRYKTGGGSVLNPEHDPERRYVETVVNRINNNLFTYKNIAEAAGIPVDQFMIKTIANANPEAVRRTDTIPYNLLRDLGLAQMKGLGHK